MALTEENIIDKYEIVGPYKHVQCRHARVIYDDGVEISRSFHRHVIAPGDNVSGEPTETQAICAAVHTPEVIAAYQAHLANQEV
jgi:hypothetical protein